MQQFFFQSLA